MLNMDLILYKNGKVITKVNSRHWWLAIFKLGMFSNPKDLSLDINIKFPNQNMLEAFLESFQKLGYTKKDFIVIDNTFCFKYLKPHTHKVWTRTWLTDSIRQYLNSKNVELYNKYLDDLIENNKIDDSKIIENKNLILIKDFIPNLLKNIPEDQVPPKQILDKVISEDEKNLIFLNRDFSKVAKDNKI